MKKRILEKMLDIRSNNLNSTSLIDNTQSSEFLTTLIDGIRKYSKLLQKSQLVPGKNNSRYVFCIEDDSDVIQLLQNEQPVARPVTNKWECEQKVLGIEVVVPKLMQLFYDNQVEDILKNILYKPFVKSVEKNVINGSYFDKPLFSTTNTITGTKDFDGLLLLFCLLH